MDNFTKTIHRLSQFIEYKGISFNKFSIQLGLSNSYFSKMVRNNASIGSDILEKIVRTYPEIDANWLIGGKGNMLKTISNEQNIVNDSHASYQIQSNRNFQQLLKEKDKEIDRLMKIIEMLAGNKEPPEGS